MIDLLRVAGALVVRDMRMSLSYKGGFALTTAGALANVGGIFFLSQAFGGGVAPLLDAYGGSYFGFVIIGVAFTNFMVLGIGGLASRIREGLLMGTLEFMLLSPNRIPVLLLGSAIWSHLFAALTVALYLALGLVLGMNFATANVPVALLGFVLAVISFNALGLLAASVVILIKQGDPVTWIVSTASALLAGVLYPTSVLPDWLQPLSGLLPLTHALEVVRRSIFRGEGLATLWPSVLALVTLGAIFLLVGLLACNAAVRLARRDGTLAYY